MMCIIDCVNLIQTVHHTHIYKLEIIIKCVISALTHKVKIVPSALLGHEFICLDINATFFA